MDQLLNKFNEYKKMDLSIDMTRGKPSKTQLDLSMPMMDVLDSGFNYLDNSYDIIYKYICQIVIIICYN